MGYLLYSHISFTQFQTLHDIPPSEPKAQSEGDGKKSKESFGHRFIGLEARFENPGLGTRLSTAALLCPKWRWRRQYGWRQLKSMLTAALKNCPF
jgi:hypothetical protein